MNGLTSIAGGLGIFENTALTTLTGLNGVTSINGGIYIQYNSALVNLTGLNGITSIDSYLDISINDVLTSLAGLEGIISIGGDLVIAANPSLTSLASLNGLTSIGGFLAIESNSSLLNLAGLNGLTSIGYLLIDANNALISLSALSGVTTIGGGGISVYLNSALASLNGLDNIDHTTISDLYLTSSGMLSICDVQSICDYLAIPSNPATISGNATGCATRAQVEAACTSSPPACTNLTSPVNGATNVSVTAALSWATAATATGYRLNVGTTPGGTNILNNVDVGNVPTYNPPGNFPFNTTIYVTIIPYNAAGNAVGCGEESFTTESAACPTNITFTSQAQIDAFPGNYPGCTAISGNVNINDAVDGNITNLNGLSQITFIGGNLDISANPNLTNLTGLNAVTAIGGGLYLLSYLTSLTGLNALSSIGGEFYISNQNISNFSGLNALTSIGGGVYIGSNSSLTSLTGLNAINSIGGYLSFQWNGALTNLSGLNALTSIGGGLGFYENNTLTSINGLDGLNSIGGFLNIKDNPVLTNLTVLNGVASIGGAITITNNAALTNLSGLENIDHTTITNIILQNSGMLSICDVQSICDYLAIPANPATISGNATGCATRAQIETACLALPVELTHFSARPKAGAIHLSWRTATETANAHFAVEHSRDGSRFREIGRVAGHGTSTEPHDYQFIHENPPPGIQYYRLRQVDLDGSHQYSHTVSVMLEAGRISMFPNPTTGLLQISGPETEDAEFRVSDPMGRVVSEGRLRGNNIDLSGLLDGIYWISLLMEREVIVRIAIKQ